MTGLCFNVIVISGFISPTATNFHVQRANSVSIKYCFLSHSQQFMFLSRIIFQTLIFTFCLGKELVEVPQTSSPFKLLTTKTFFVIVPSINNENLFCEEYRILNSTLFESLSMDLNPIFDCKF